MTDNTLTPKQQRYIEEYLVDLNQRQAAIRAGYSEASASNIAYDLMHDERILRAIEAAQEARRKRVGITADEVLNELVKLAKANMQDFMVAQPGGDPYLDFSALTRDQAAALQEVTVEDYTEGRGENARDVKRVKFRLCDKRAALVDIGKHLGMFIDRKDIRFPEGVPVTQLTKDEFKELAGPVVGGV
jgi:phage terminase small subunit